MIIKKCGDAWFYIEQVYDWNILKTVKGSTAGYVVELFAHLLTIDFLTFDP